MQGSTHSFEMQAFENGQSLSVKHSSTKERESVENVGGLLTLI
jgi:hypothetical protein